MNKIFTTNRRLSRRSFVGAATTIVVVPFMTPAAMAADKVDENDPTAMALGYRHDASKVDVTKYPQRAGDAAANNFCSSCVLYTGDASSEWGPCTIFPGKEVAAKGWCISFAPKP